MRAWFIVGLVALTAAGFSQGVLSLYSPGRSVADQGIRLLGWGAGLISESDDVAFEGTTSIRISTRNFFQGGVLSYSRPVNLAPSFEDKFNLLQLAVLVPARTGSGPGVVGGGVGGPGRGGGDEGRAGIGGGGAPGAGAPPQAEEEPEIRRLRGVIRTTDGKMSEFFVDLSTSRANVARSWTKVGIPLQAITGLAATNKEVASIAFSGDATATLYIGEARILNDTTPITGELRLTDQNIGSGTSLELFATGFGGASVLRFTWTIRGADGSTVLAEGPFVRQRFGRPGTYRVTVTIADAFGLKSSWTSSPVTITVN